MQALNINAHRAQLAREPGKYLGHLPNGSAKKLFARTSTMKSP